MTAAPPLSVNARALICGVLKQHPDVQSAVLFGSRAKGTHTERSDVDLALVGEIGPLRAAAIADKLEELPLPYRFDVQPLEHIENQMLLEHIARVGIRIYPDY